MKGAEARANKIEGCGCTRAVVGPTKRSTEKKGPPVVVSRNLPPVATGSEGGGEKRQFAAVKVRGYKIKSGRLKANLSLIAANLSLISVARRRDGVAGESRLSRASRNIGQNESEEKNCSPEYHGFSGAAPDGRGTDARERRRDGYRGWKAGGQDIRTGGGGWEEQGSRRRAREGKRRARARERSTET